MNRSRVVTGALVAIAFLVVVLAYHANTVSWAASPDGQVKAAWEKAKAGGAVEFRSQIVQTTQPLPRIENMGLSSTSEYFYVEGRTDLPKQTMQIKLWSDSGSAQSEQNALEVKVADSRTLGRTGQGEWKEIPNNTDIFAPDSDPLAFLAGAKQIGLAGQENRGGINVTRYTFQMDGPAFAEYMRRRMEADLKASGKLPTSVSLGLIKQYVDMTGHGEIWLGSNGLPLREIINLEYPPERLQQISVEITTDFEGWAPDSGGQGSGLSLLSTRNWSLDVPFAALVTRSPQLATMLLLVLLFWLAIRYRRSPVLYWVLVVSVIASMTVSPLLDARRVAAFSEEQQTQQVFYQAERDRQERLQQWETELNKPGIDPNQSPLAGFGLAESPLRQGAWPSVADEQTDRLGFEGQIGPGSAAVLGAVSPGDSTSVGSQDISYPDCTWTDPSGDKDNDGLTNSQEKALDTNPCSADTDDDGLPDGVEVVGFDLGGKHWYLDSVGQDSDRDGIVDGIECSDLSLDDAELADGHSANDLFLREKGRDPQSRRPLACQDTDRDGIPDVWDRDSDGDGVPDHIDLGVTTVMSGFANSTFDLKLQNFTPLWPLVVELQYRPVNPKHLWYALNVLDWPNGSEGQVSRRLDTKYGDSGKNANGDTRLIPMMEIEIPFDAASYGGLPVKPGFTRAITAGTSLDDWLDKDRLSSYGIAVKRKDNQGTLLAYVPANQVRDPNGDDPVAFESVMFYRPQTASFGASQHVRLVWLIQTLVDQCDSAAKPADTGLDRWCADTSHWRTLPEPQVVQTYYDDWYVTGLSAREDHGLDAGVVFEDPAYATSQADFDSAKYVEDNLWFLANGLDSTFISGSTVTATGVLTPVRDLTLPKVQRTFDNTLNAGTIITDRFGLDREAFRVITYAYDTQAGIADLATSKNQDILSTYFEPYSTTVAAPTLLYLREERSRNVVVNTGGALTATSAYTVDLSLANAPLQTLASINWSPFQRKGAGVWEPYPIDNYMERLDSRVRPAFANSPDFGYDRDVIEGATLVAKANYAAMLTGMSGLVELSGRPTSLPTARSSVDVALDVSTARLSGKIGGAAAKFIAGKLSANLKWATKLFGASAANDQQAFLKLIGEIDPSKPSGLSTKLAKLQRLSTNTRIGIGLGIAAVAITFVIFGVATATGDSKIPDRAVKWGTVIASTAFALGLQTKSILDAVKALKAGMKTLSVTNKVAAIKTMSKMVTKASKIGAVVGLVVTALTAGALFAHRAATGGISFGSVAFNTALAEMIATIIIGALILAIGLIPIIGQLIVAVVAIIDALVGFICFLTGADESEVAEEWGLCGGITGILTKLVQYFIYSSHPIVDLYKDNRMGIGVPSTSFRNPSLGIQQGNSVDASLPITSTLFYTDPSPGLGWLYYWQYGNGYVKQSDFKYELQTVTSTIHSDLNTDDKDPNYWGSSAVPDGAFSRAWTATGSFTLTQAGLSWKPRLYLAEGHAINVQECWTFVCYLEDEKDTVHLDVSDLYVLDVFPPTFDEFYTLSSRDNGGFSLAWDSRFPVQCDADGDGLRSTACRGNDLDDSSVDSDGDGLSDIAELRIGTDPRSLDLDGDGLTDYQEVLYGTNPIQPDSDGDGLQDCEEVIHPVLTRDRLGLCGEVGTWSGGWMFTYDVDSSGHLLQTLVVSNPRNSMTADDGMFDSQKKMLGFNPNVPSGANLLKVTASNSAYGTGDMFYVKPGDSFAYTETVKNNLIDRKAIGLAEVGFPTVASRSGLVPQPLSLSPNQLVTVAGSLTVAPGITRTQQLSLTNRAGANLISIADERLLSLRFEEGTGATSFADASLKQGDVRCTASCPTAGASGYSGNGLQLNGSTQYLSLGSASSLGLYDSSFTVLLWVKGTGFSGTSGDVPLLAINGEEANKSLHLTVLNGKPYMGFYGNDTAGTATLNSNQWYQLAFRYDKTNQEQAIFVNGAKNVAQTGRTSLQGTGQVLLGRWNSRYFGGVIDELEIYPRALSDDEIGDGVSGPVLRLGFDGSWSDSSPYQSAVTQYKGATASATGGPTIVGGGGKVGGGAGFSGNKYAADGGKTLRVAASQNLDLSSGDFTQSFWVAPSRLVFTETTSTGYPNGLPVQRARQGVLGAEGVPGSAGASEYAYPFVQLVAPNASDASWRNERWYEQGQLQDHYYRRIRVGFSEQCSGQTDQVVPDDGGWHHVAVTYNAAQKSYAVYLDGGPVTTTMGLPSSCASPAPSDPGKPVLIGRSRAVFGNPAAERSVTIGGVKYTDDRAQITGYPGSVTLQNTCVTFYDQANFRGNSQEFCASGTTAGWQGSKVASFALTPRVYPFDGKLDDVRVYRRALSAAEVGQMAQAAKDRLMLAFDEPPGAHSFADTSGNYLTANCSGDSCPASGLPGRANNALRFDGVQDYVQTTMAATVVTDNVTLFAAVYWEGPTSGDQVIVYNGNPAANGYGILVKPDGKLAIKNGPNGSLVTNEALPMNKWQYVTATRANGTWRLYLNRFLKDTTGSHSVTAPLATDKTMIGGNQVDAYFRGLIDEVRITESGYSGSGTVWTANDGNPGFNIHLDDPPGTTRFDVGTNWNTNLYCSGSACPQAGAKGWIRDSVFFDGQNDMLRSDRASDYDAYFGGGGTVSLWVRPASVPNGIKNLVSYGDQSYNNQPRSTQYWAGITSTNSSAYLWFCKDSGSLRCANPSQRNSLAIQSKSPLALNTWNHVAVTSSGGTVRLYINGALDSSRAMGDGGAGGILELGGRYDAAGYFFNGQMDEVQVWDQAFSGREIRALYDAQTSWFDAAIRSNFTVDADKPVAALDLGSPYLNNQPDQILCFSPTDATTAVAKAQYDAGNGWQDATPDGETWCFIYTPPSPGPQTISVRAHDMVGNWSDAAPTQMYVDVEPASFSVDPGLKARVLDGANSRVMLSGQAGDTRSGVASLTVDLLDQAGVSTGDTLTATLSADGTWQALYPFRLPPNGYYTVKLQGVDRVGNASTRTGDVVRVDGTPPVASLTYTGVSTRTISGIGASLPTISGTVTETPDANKPISSGVAKLEVGFLHAKDRDYPERTIWQEATLESPGQATSNWRLRLPEGLEGPYRIDLRATDGLGHVQLWPNRWSGEIDTTAPKIQITATIQGDRIRYDTMAQDYNLREQGFGSFCGAGVVTTRTNYTADWYKTMIGTPLAKDRSMSSSDQAVLNSKPYQFSASCLLDDPPTMGEEGAHDTPGRVSAVAVSQTMAYVLDYGQALRVVDISDPAIPREVGALADGGDGVDVAVAGNFLYVPYNRNNRTFGLKVIDVANPAGPTLMGSPAIAFAPNGVAVSGTIAYVATQRAMVVIDVRDPAGPYQVGTYATGGPAYGVASTGNRAYVAIGEKGLRIVDVSNPASPSTLGAYDTPGNAQKVAVSGNYAYVADGLGGLRIVDVTNPLSPTETGVFSAGGSVNGVAVAGAHAYLTVAGKGLQVVDVSVPSAPRRVLAYTTPERTSGAPRGLALAGSYVYVADGTAGLRVVNTAKPPEATASDLLGNRSSTAVPGLTAAQIGQLRAARQALQSIASDQSVDTGFMPPPPVVLTSTVPYTFSGLVAAMDGHFLQGLTITVDSQAIYTATWAGVDTSADEWEAVWTPSGEGAHTITASVTDRLGGTGVQTATVVLDTQLPSITLSRNSFTAADYGALGTLALTGIVTDTNGVAGVQVAVNGAGAPVILDETAGSWLANWSLGLATPPDGLAYTVAMTATDLAGWISTASSIIVLDAVPPQPFTATMAYTNAVGVLTPIQPGTVISDVLSPTLTIVWTSAQDGGSIAHYYAGWSPTSTLSSATGGLTTFGPAARQHSQKVGEAQKLYAHVVAEDAFGNRTARYLGPVYADYPLTPDYVVMDGPGSAYRQWTNTGCTLVGVDSRVRQRAPAGATLSQDQRLYATWSDATLRLTWAGANWDRNGDLFIYLATPGAGTNQAYDAFGEGRPISLPLAANYLIWVKDSRTASLLRWDGTAWVDTSDPNVVYRFDGNAATPFTDLAVPFASLGIADPNSSNLELLALATEENRQRFWATMPVRNAVNSLLVADGAEAGGRATGTYGVPTRAYQLQLGDGLCPASSVLSQADVSISLGATPAGYGVTTYEDGWTKAQGNLLQSLVANGDLVAYQLDYVNRGATVASGVTVTATGSEVNLDGSTSVGPYQWRRVFSLPDLAPGAQGSVTFTGQVAFDAANTNPISGVASVDLVFSHDLSAYVGEPAGGQRLSHRIDYSPPSLVKIVEPSGVVGAGINLIKGIARDESAVPTVEVQVQAPSGGTTSLSCSATDADGGWTCPWTVAASGGDETFSLRAKATDRGGNVSGWSSPVTVAVDRQPAAVTLDTATEATLATGFLRSGASTLSGRLEDGHLISRLEVCATDAACKAAQIAPFAGSLPQTTFRYGDEPASPVAVGADQIQRTFVVADNFTVSGVNLGFNADLLDRSTAVVTLQSPAGTQVVLHKAGGAAAKNLDVTWDDAAGLGVADDQYDHTAAGPYYENSRQSEDPLTRFEGENAQGTWTLAIADQGSLGANGAYNHSQLVLWRDFIPTNTGAAWSYDVLLPASADGVNTQLSLYGYDSVGNRSDPTIVTYQVDNVAPVITVTNAITQVQAGLGLTPTEVLVGSVSDGGGFRTIYAMVQAPSRSYAERIDTDAQGSVAFGRIRTAAPATGWRYLFQPTESGDHSITVVAQDMAGNTTTVGPHVVSVPAPPLPPPPPVVPMTYRLFLPFVTSGYDPGPDLVVYQIIAEGDTLQVVIQNRGNQAVADEFWVDLYVDPNPPPTAVNQVWNDGRSSQGVVWGVTAEALPSLGPGGTLTLTVGDAYYWPSLSSFPGSLPAETPLYVQVDSSAAGSSYGAVRESHEVTGGGYNNIMGPIPSGETSLGPQLAGAGGTKEGNRLSLRQGMRAATPTATATATPTASPTITSTATPTVTSTATTMSATATASASSTAAPVATPTASPSSTVAPATTVTPTAVPSSTPEARPSATPTISPTAVPTATPTRSVTPAPPSQIPTGTPTSSAALLPTALASSTSRPRRRRRRKGQGPDVLSPLPSRPVLSPLPSRLVLSPLPFRRERVRVRVPLASFKAVAPHPVRGLLSERPSIPWQAPTVIERERDPHPALSLSEGRGCPSHHPRQLALSSCLRRWIHGRGSSRSRTLHGCAGVGLGKGRLPRLPRRREACDYIPSAPSFHGKEESGCPLGAVRALGMRGGRPSTSFRTLTRISGAEGVGR